MRTQPEDIRCKACRTLLGKLDTTGFTIVRNELQATFSGDCRATLVCYHARCRTLNVLELHTRA